jgi:DNA polymerase III beta subunit, central domain
MHTFTFTLRTEAIKALLLFAAQKDIRYYMVGANVCTNDGKLYIQATDGHRAIRMQLSATDAPPADVSVTIPLAMLKDAAKQKGGVLVTLADAPVSADNPKGKTVHSKGDTYNCTMPAVDGAYPDISRILPHTPQADLAACPFKVNPQYLHDAAKAIDTLLDRKDPGTRYPELLQRPMPDKTYNGNAAFWYSQTALADKAGLELAKRMSANGVLETVIVIMPLY